MDILEEVIKNWGKSIVTDEGLISDLVEAIRSWIKEVRPKEVEGKGDWDFDQNKANIYNRALEAYSKALGVEE